MKLSERSAQHWLVGIWMGAGVPLIALVFAQTVLFDVYGSKDDEVLKWLLGAVVPTASLMIGVLVSQARSRKAPRRQADRFLFGLAAVLSVVYLLALAATVAAAALGYSTGPIDRAATFLQLFNGLVAAALGAFFVAQPKDGSGGHESHATRQGGTHAGATAAPPAG